MSATRKKTLLLIFACIVVLSVGSFVHSQETQPDTIDAHTPAELKAFVDARPFALENVDEYLIQKDVPVLVDMLGDPRYRKDWGVLSMVLARLDKGTDAQHAIIHMIRRGDIWPRNDRDLRRFVWTKINAVGTLGHTNGDVARATVRDALTENGAAKLAEEWLGRDLPAEFQSNPGGVVSAIRGRAALGLVYSLDEDNVRMVEKLYESMAPDVKKRRAHLRESSLGFYDLTLEEQNLDGLFNALVSALATRDLIRDVGNDQFLEIAADNDALYRALGGYLRKYSAGSYN